jgi:hypothetical protein
MMRFKDFILKFWLVLALATNGLCSVNAQSYQPKSINVYFFPGQGSDQRIFRDFELHPYCTKHFFELPLPFEGEKLAEYASRFIPKIDTTAPYVFIGTSLGGMICSELTNQLNPIATIVIASAKNRNEMPFQYRFQRIVPLNTLPPPMFYKASSFIAQPIVEPDRKREKDLFISMLKEKDPVYMKRTVDMMINWERTVSVEGVYHIHGNLDNTLPIKNIEYDTLIEYGSHMMTLLRSADINVIVNQRIELAYVDL